MFKLSTIPRVLAFVAGAALVAAGAAVGAQENSVMKHGAHHAAAAGTPVPAVPTLPGQDAFGAMQEVIAILESDPDTDWSRVNIAALREHLVDMNEMTLHAVVTAIEIDRGSRFEITAQRRTLEAIRRMVPAHAREMNGRDGWSAEAAPLANGIALTLSSADPDQVARIRALGFFGFMAGGGHHQPHHLAIARGESVH